MSQEKNIKHAVELLEKHVEKMYDLAFEGLPKKPAFDMYKASAMMEISRRIRKRALKLEDDFNHMTRD